MSQGPKDGARRFSSQDASKYQIWNSSKYQIWDSFLK